MVIAKRPRLWLRACGQVPDKARDSAESDCEICATPGKPQSAKSCEATPIRIRKHSLSRRRHTESTACHKYQASLVRWVSTARRSVPMGPGGAVLVCGSQSEILCARQDR